jgi:branched-chain amino acid transport system permease protein
MSALALFKRTDDASAARFLPFAVLALAASGPLWAGPYVVHLAVLTCLNILIVNGLSIIERSGQLSFGHSAFVAIGAYASVLATTLGGAGILLSAAAGIAASALCAWLLGAIILRLKGVYFVLVTFAFAELTRLVLLDWAGLTGGANGIAGIPPIELFGFAFDSRIRYYALALGFAVASLLLILYLFHRPVGHAMDAVRENPSLAESSGLSVYRLQLLAFVLGCALAGLGGVLMARYIGFISPESFNLAISVSLITMLVIGGRRSMWGPLVGALILTPLPELFRGAVQTQHIFYGAALILILRFLPEGLAGLGQGLRRFRKRQA